MKFQTKAADLKKALKKMLTIALRGESNLPVPNNIKIEASGTQLMLTYTNLEQSVSMPVEATVQEDGATTVHAKTLRKIVTGCTDAAIQVTTGKKHLTLDLDGYSYRLDTIDAEEYPDAPRARMPRCINMPQRDLLRAMTIAKKHVSTEQSRRIITGSYLQIGDDVVKLVATDGRRLTELSIPCHVESGQDDITGGIIPCTAIKAMCAMLGDTDDNVRLHIDSVRIELIFGDALIASKLIEGKYPQYGQVIPQDCETPLIFNRAQMMRFAKKSQSVNPDKFVKIEDTGERLKVSCKAGDMTISSHVNKTGGSFEGSIALHAKYLADMLAQGKDETVLHIPGSVNGIISGAVKIVDDGEVYVLMCANH